MSMTSNTSKQPLTKENKMTYEQAVIAWLANAPKATLQIGSKEVKFEYSRVMYESDHEWACLTKFEETTFPDTEYTESAPELEYLSEIDSLCEGVGSYDFGYVDALIAGMKEFPFERFVEREKMRKESRKAK